LKIKFYHPEFVRPLEVREWSADAYPGLLRTTRSEC